MRKLTFEQKDSIRLWDGKLGFIHLYYGFIYGRKVSIDIADRKIRANRKLVKFCYVYERKFSVCSDGYYEKS